MGTPTSIAIGDRETIYICTAAPNHLLAITEALGVEGINCDIYITDRLGRGVGDGDIDDRQLYLSTIPGATYETDGTEPQFISRAAIPHPIKFSFYSVTDTPRPDATTYSLRVVEGTNRYFLAEDVLSNGLPDEYTLRYPQLSPPTEIIRIHIRPEDLPVFNGRVIMPVGTSGDFTAIGIDNLGQEWIIAARWRVTPSVGRLTTVRKARTRINASLRAGARGLVMIKYKKMTARIPIRVVSGRARSRR